MIPRVTVEDCIAMLDSNENAGTIRDWLRYCFMDVKNIDTFGKFFFPDAFFKPFAPVHYTLIDELWRPESTADAFPRGWGKSTLIRMMFAIWNLVYRKINYLVYISETFPKATQFIEPIRFELGTNELLNFVYGPFKIGKVKDDKTGKDRENMFNINNMLVQAMSFDGSIRGIIYKNFRPDLMIMDDIEDRKRVNNPVLRADDLEKYTKDIYPALDPEGVFKFIGTILHPLSLLKNYINKWNGIIMAAEDEKGNSRWPERFPKRILDKMLFDMGPLSYAQELMNKPTGNQASIIKRKHCMWCCDEELSYGDEVECKTKVLGWDQAFSDLVTADNTVYLTVVEGVDKYEGKYVITECIWEEKGMSGPDQLNKINTIILPGNNYHYVAAEENAIRSFSSDIIKNIKFPYKLFNTAGSDPSAKKKKEIEFKDKRHTVGKINMIERMAGRFQMKRYVLPYKTDEDKIKTNRFIDEATSWGRQDGKLVEVGIHPDAPIGLGLGSELLDLLNNTQSAFGVVNIGEYAEDEVEKTTGRRIVLCYSCKQHFFTRKVFKGEKDCMCIKCIDKEVKDESEVSP